MDSTNLINESATCVVNVFIILHFMDMEFGMIIQHGDVLSGVLYSIRYRYIV